MNANQERMYDALCEMNGDEVTNLFTNWLGLQVLDDEFEEFLVEEGVLDEDSDY